VIATRNELALLCSVVTCFYQSHGHLAGRQIYIAQWIAVQQRCPAPTTSPMFRGGAPGSSASGAMFGPAAMGMSSAMMQPPPPALPPHPPHQVRTWLAGASRISVGCVHTHAAAVRVS
jgi:hypothetical protein